MVEQPNEVDKEERKQVEERIKELRVEATLDEIFNFFVTRCNAQGSNKWFSFDISAFRLHEEDKILWFSKQCKGLYKIHIVPKDELFMTMQFQVDTDKVDFIKEKIIL